MENLQPANQLFSPTLVTYSVSFCDSYVPNDKSALLDAEDGEAGECYSKEVRNYLKRSKRAPILKGRKFLDHCHCAKSFPRGGMEVGGHQRYRNQT